MNEHHQQKILAQWLMLDRLTLAFTRLLLFMPRSDDLTFDFAHGFLRTSTGHNAGEISIKDSERARNDEYGLLLVQATNRQA